jgi:hypothetical protein
MEQPVINFWGYLDDCRLTSTTKKELSIEYIYWMGSLRRNQECGRIDSGSGGRSGERGCKRLRGKWERRNLRSLLRWWTKSGDCGSIFLPDRGNLKNSQIIDKFM